MINKNQGEAAKPACEKQSCDNDELSYSIDDKSKEQPTEEINKVEIKSVHVRCRHEFRHAYVISDGTTVEIHVALSFFKDLTNGCGHMRRIVVHPKRDSIRDLREESPEAVATVVNAELNEASGENVLEMWRLEQWNSLRPHKLSDVH